MSKCEKRCKDCIHCEVCENNSFLVQFDKNNIAYCTTFKDKSLFVELPCKVGDKVIKKISRKAMKNTEKEAKKRGLIRVKIDIPKPPTNFDKITQNVDSFIKWVLDNYNSVPPTLDCKASCNKDCGECFKKWLLQDAE